MLAGYGYFQTFVHSYTAGHRHRSFHSYSLECVPWEASSVPSRLHIAPPPGVLRAYSWYAYVALITSLICWAAVPQVAGHQGAANLTNRVLRDVVRLMEAGEVPDPKVRPDVQDRVARPHNLVLACGSGERQMQVCHLGY